MASTDSVPRKEHIVEPPRVWSDPIVDSLRTSSVVVAIYVWISNRLVPLLFCVFIAAPIGVLILPFFLPKFRRNRLRRRKYGVVLSPDLLDRIHGTPTGGFLTDRDAPPPSPA